MANEQGNKRASNGIINLDKDLFVLTNIIYFYNYKSKIKQSIRNHFIEGVGISNTLKMFFVSRS